MELFGRRGRTLSNNLYFSAARKCSLAVQSMEWGVVENWEEGGGKIEDSRWVGIRRSEARFCLASEKNDFGVDLIVED